MSALGQKQTFETALEMSALPPKADIVQHAIEDGVVADRPSICCTGDDDSGVCAVARSCKQKKFPQAGSCAAAPASEPGRGGAVDSHAPWVKLRLAACHEPRSLSVLSHACARDCRISSRSKSAAAHTHVTPDDQVAPPRSSHVWRSLCGRTPSRAWASCSTALSSACARSTGPYRPRPA